MPRMIFVNLPVADLNASVDYYKSLGFEQNPQFSGEPTAVMAWSEAIYATHRKHAKSRTSTDRPSPPPTPSEGSLSLACYSRDGGDAITKAASKHAGAADLNRAQDHGFMYQRTFADP